MSGLKDDGKALHLDEVLSQLGAFGKHQLATMLMLALVYSTNSMYNINYVFAVEDVGYRCKIPTCDHGTSSFHVSWLNQSESLVKQCSYQPADPGCSSFRNQSVPCQEWLYEVPDSFVAEFGLACDDWKQTLVGTAHSFGNMLGQLVQGHLSDKFGRKTTAVFAGTAGAILGISKSYSTSFWFYIVLEGLEAAIGDALSPIFMLSIELVEKNKAILIQMILLNCYTLGLIILPFVAWAFPYWRTFLRVIYAPTLLIVTYSFFLDESVRWLFSKGRREEAIKLIQKIAKRNNVELDKNTLSKLDYVDEETKNDFSDKRVLLKTFKSRIMMQRFLVCIVWWFTITLISYGMMISSVFIDGNKYINFALLTLMDIPANVFYWLALTKYNRRMLLFMSFLVEGIFCISQLFVPKVSGYAWAGLALFMASETLSTFSYNIVITYTTELFPTYTRNSMHSICSAVGRVGSLVAPQTPLLLSVWSGLPALIFGVCAILCSGLTLLMPETAKCELPDTVAEAERIGRKKPDPLLKKLEQNVETTVLRL